MNVNEEKKKFQQQNKFKKIWSEKQEKRENQINKKRKEKEIL
jgi:hypothetical protein